MEMWVWNAALTIILALVGWGVRTKDKQLEDMDDEVKRLQVLLNRTREEIAKEYVTKSEVHTDINRVLDRLERLDTKLDRLMEVRHAS
jgi:hypothetical protein